MVCSYHVTSGIDRLVSCRQIGFWIVFVDISVSSAEAEAKMDQPCDNVWAEERKSWQCSRNSEISQVISRGFCFSLLTSLYVGVELVGLKVKKNACFTTYADIKIDLRLQWKLLTVSTSEIKKKIVVTSAGCLQKWALEATVWQNNKGWSLMRLRASETNKINVTCTCNAN